MNNRWFLIFAAIVVLAFGGFLYVAWPYRGLVPNITPSPIEPQVVPTTSSTQPVVTGEQKPGTNTTGLPLKLPEGFSINVFAKGLGGPRDLLTLSDGTILASIPAQGRVVALVDENGDGVAEVKNVITGLNKPHGLAVGDIDSGDSTARLFVAETDALVSYTYDAKARTVSGRSVLTKLSTGGRHTTKSLVLLEDMLYVSNGSSCDVCHEEDPQRAAVWVYDLGQKTFELYAKGLRNAVFMTSRTENGPVWVTEMGRDFLGDDLPPDEINVLEKDKNYGWPTCYGKNIHDTVFDKNTYIRNPCMEPLETQSKIDLPAHSAPLGLEFLPSNRLSGAWGEYGDNLLVAYHGSWNRSEPTGYKVHRFVLDAAGNVIKDDDFLSGWLDEAGVLGRPADIEYDATSDALYISDDRSGVIYRVTPPKR